MNVLFFIEPLIQRDNPMLQEPWLHLHVKNIIQALKESDFNIFIALNSALSEKLEDIEYKDQLKGIFSFKQKELKMFSSSSLEILKKWYKKTYSKEEMILYKKLMINKFEGVKFDIIISFSPIPYLKEIYPEALFLFYEYGMFSRKPYPKTYHLDPVEFGGYEYIDKYYDDIENNLMLTSKEEEIFSEFLNKIKGIVLKSNPFEKEIKKLREKFDYLLLLPMQASGYWAFDFETKYKSQFEYLEDVLIKTVKFKNIGIIVTQHSSNVFLNDDRVIQYFKNEYDNFILLESIKNYSEISPLLVPYVDGIIIISTSIGYHSLLWDKKLITLGNKYLKKLSDSDNLENLDKILKGESKNRKKILYWLLTRYYILENYVTNSNWIQNYLKNVENKKNNLKEFYDIIDCPQLIFNNFIEQCSSISDSITGQYVQIYINYGKGYYEENSCKFLYNCEIKLNFSNKYIEYILLKFNEIDSVCIENAYCVNKDDKISNLMKSDNPDSYKNFQNQLLIDRLKFMEYKINDEIKEINISIKDYKVLEKNEMFEKLYNLEQNLINSNKENTFLIEEKKELIKQNNELIKENKNLIDEKNRTFKARVLRKINQIKSKIK